MQGLHILAELKGCQCEATVLTQQAKLQAVAMTAIEQAGLSAVAQQWHTFPAYQGQTGVTGVVLLAESHLALHTWPEHNAVTLDIYVCNFSTDNTLKAQAAFDALSAVFSPSQCSVQHVQRGNE